MNKKCPICNKKLINNGFNNISVCHTESENIIFKGYYEFHYYLYNDKSDCIITNKYGLFLRRDNKYGIYVDMNSESLLFLNKNYVIKNIKNIDEKINNILVFK